MSIELQMGNAEAGMVTRAVMLCLNLLQDLPPGIQVLSTHILHHEIALRRGLHPSEVSGYATKFLREEENRPEVRAMRMYVQKEL